MLNFFFGIVLIIFLLYMTVLYESISIYLLSIFVFSVLAVAFLYLLILRIWFKVTIEIPIGIAQKDKNISIKINIKNAKILGCKKMRFKIAYKKNSQKKYNKIWLSVNTVPSGESQFSYDLNINSADCYEFKILKAKYYDLLGLFYLTKRFKTSSYVTVFPEVNPIPVSVGQRVISFISDTDIYDEYRPGDDIGEIFDVREYRQGDRLSNIHWKLSSKRDDLVVKEGSLLKSCPAIIFFNGCKGDSNVIFDNLASISYSMMDAGCAHYVAWISKTEKDIIRMRVDDEDSFYESLLMLMENRENNTCIDIKNQYYDKYLNETVLYEILFEDEKIYVNDIIVDDINEYEMILG